MPELAKYAGLICAAVSFIMQLVILFTKADAFPKEEMSRVCREAAGAAMVFFVFSWIFGVSMGMVLNIAPLIWKISLGSAILFALWCLSALKRNASPQETKIFAGLRNFCLVYSIVGYVLGFFLR